MRTTILTLMLMTAGYASQASEEMFLKGCDYALQGKDSLACYFYGQAYRMDSSLGLLEIYSKSLLKAGDTNSYIENLRRAGDERLKRGDWNAAFLNFKGVFDQSRMFLDANKMSLAIFKDGLANSDSVKIKYANTMWNLLINKTISYKCKSNITIQIIDTQIQAHKEADSFKPSGKKFSIFFSKVIV